MAAVDPRQHMQVDTVRPPVPIKVGAGRINGHGSHITRAYPEGRRQAGDRRNAHGRFDASRRRAWIAQALVGAVLIIVGVFIMAYPTISNYLSELHASSVIVDYDETIAQYAPDVLERARAEAVEYNENLAGDPVHDPFVPGSGYALPENYEQVLNLAGDGVMGYIEIPAISVQLPIYHSSSEEVLARGVGHIEQTALPIGEEGRNPVLTAHRGLPQAELFSRLDELKIGDEFYITVLDEVMAYRVDDISVIEPDEMAKLSAHAGHDYVTLATCTPYGVNTHRLLVRGERCEYNPAHAEAGEAGGWRISPFQLGIGLGVAVLACIVATVKIAKSRGRRHG